MNRNWKRIILSAVALLLISLGSGYVANNTVNAKIRRPIVHREISHRASHWRKGMPKPFKERTLWQTGFERVNPRDYGKRIRYVHYRAVLGLTEGFSPRIRFCNKHYKTIYRKWLINPRASINPHYQKLNKNWYRITSGAIGNNKQSLHRELRHSLAYDVGMTELIHVHHDGSISVWCYERANSGRKNYMGTYYRDFKSLFKYNPSFKYSPIE